MPFQKFELKPGHELRGLVIRLYPSPEDEEKLEIVSRDTKRAWNWLVKQVEDVLAAREAFALRQGLVPPKPVRPDYNGMTPEQSKAAKDDFHESCRTWQAAVYEATKDDPSCAFRSFKDLLAHYGFKHDYQLLSRVIDWAYEDGAERSIKPGAHMLQALTKNYFSKGKGQKRKKIRGRLDSMPLQVRSGDCFELGDFGSRGASHHRSEVAKTYYDCRVKFNGLKIRGRLPGKAPEGRILEGVSIIKKADGWWASVKQEVPIRVPPPAIPNSRVGLDVGLDLIAAISEARTIEKPEAKLFTEMGPVIDKFNKPRRIANARGKVYAERIAGRQAEKKPVGRLHLAADRHVRHTIYNEIIKPLGEIEVIQVEKLSAKIGQMGSSKTSAMRKVVSLLQERYKDRVREVPCAFTSQDCSQCGFRSKESWSYEHGRIGACPACGHREDRDVNAARNVAAKASTSLESC
jgi:transposase